MENFLNEQAIRESKVRAQRTDRLFWVLVVLGPVFLVILCLLTGIGNARTMFPIALLCLILLGWAAIACWIFYTEPAKTETKHMQGLLEGMSETWEGRIRVGEDRFRIPKSVFVRKVYLETDEETLSLNLNERLLYKMPPDGSWVRIRTVHKFVTAMEVVEAADTQSPRKALSRLKTFSHALQKLFPAALLWAMIVPIFIGFIFSRITDTDALHKIVLYVDCMTVNEDELARKLEQGMDGTIRMVQVHPFSYALFGTEALKTADLYIVPDSEREEYAEWLGEELAVVYNPADGTKTAGMYFLYTPDGTEPEMYRLYTGTSSVHLEDGLARKAAELLTAETEKEATE